MPSKDGGPAFPNLHDVEWESGHGLALKHPGMSILDYFAAEAMHAILLSTMTNEAAALTHVERAKRHGIGTREMTAAAAYEIAETMVAEKRRREP